MKNLFFVVLFLFSNNLYSIFQNELSLAVKKGDLTQVKAAVAKGIDVNEIVFCSESPLCIASALGYVEIAKFLLKSGADPRLREGVFGRTPLHIASGSGHVKIVKCLLDHDPSLLHELDNNLETALFQAASLGGNIQVMQILISAGINIEATNNEGQTALRPAAARIESLKILLAAGAKVNYITSLNTTTDVHNAAARGDDVVLRILLDAGARSDITGPLGSTPFEVALKFEKVEVAKTFEKWAVQVKNAKKKTKVLQMTVINNYNQYSQLSNEEIDRRVLNPFYKLEREAFMEIVVKQLKINPLTTDPI